MEAKYGDRVTVYSTPDLLVLRPPRATLVLGPPAAAARERARRTGVYFGPSAMDLPEDIFLPRPPPVPAAPRDDGTIGALLALLPPADGAPILSPGRPPSAQYPLGEPPHHRFPSLLYERITDDYVARAPLGLPLVGATTELRLASLPTAISGTSLGRSNPIGLNEPWCAPTRLASDLTAI